MALGHTHLREVWRWRFTQTIMDTPQPQDFRSIGPTNSLPIARSLNVRGASACAVIAAHASREAGRKTLRRAVMGSVVLEHRPEDLHTAVIPPGQRHVVVFGDFFQ